MILLPYVRCEESWLCSDLVLMALATVFFGEGHVLHFNSLTLGAAWGTDWTDSSSSIDPALSFVASSFKAKSTLEALNFVKAFSRKPFGGHSEPRSKDADMTFLAQLEKGVELLNPCHPLAASRTLLPEYLARNLNCDDDGWGDWKAHGSLLREVLAAKQTRILQI
mmetsp:Transcript_35303/g.55128  ORF Transcript_35303/g.55128 Transcript_35303/m.55128 type:complete len:166 (+) Transcript_35303:360-857(+)